MGFYCDRCHQHRDEPRMPWGFICNSCNDELQLLTTEARREELIRVENSITPPPNGFFYCGHCNGLLPFDFCGHFGGTLRLCYRCTRAWDAAFEFEYDELFPPKEVIEVDWKREGF